MKNTLWSLLFVAGTRAMKSRYTRTSCMHRSKVKTSFGHLFFSSAGTGAMKSGYTRTGKRTTGGAIDDGKRAFLMGDKHTQSRNRW